MIQMLTVTFAAFALFAMAGGEKPAAATTELPENDGRLVLKAAHVILSPGKSIDRGVVIIEKGKISAVGTDLGVPLGAIIHDFGNATITAGLVDAHADWGSEGEITDTTFAVTPGVRAADARRIVSKSMRLAAAAGITTVALAPDAENLVGGLAAIVKSYGKEPLIREEGFLKLSFSRNAFDGDRYPTSFGGGIGALERLWTLAGTDPAKAKSPAEAIFAKARKDLHPWFEVDGDFAIRQALKLTKSLKLPTVLVLSGTGAESAAEIAAAKVPVVFRTLNTQSGPDLLRSFKIITKSGAEWALASMGSRSGQTPEALRTSAQLAVAQGVDKVAAWASVTTVPARLLGISEIAGAVEVGQDADLCVYSGDPLDARSALLQVYVRGNSVKKEEGR